MPGPVKIAVIGVGSIGPRHAQSVIGCPNAVLACIVDPSPAAEAVARNLRTSWYRSCREMLESSDKPDAAIVCTPNHTHVSVSRDLLGNGVHVLVEKPISTDVESAQDLVEYAATCTSKLLVGHHRRFQPVMLAAKSAIASGSLGRVIAVNGLWMTCKPEAYFQEPTAWRQSSTGGTVLLVRCPVIMSRAVLIGVLQQNMIHDVDLLQFMLGPITRVHVEETIKQRNFEAEEGAAILFRFASGAVGTFLLSDAVPSPYSFEQGTGENPILPKTGQDVYRIFGTKASLSIPDMTRWSYDGVEDKSWLKPLTQEKLEVEQATPFDLQVEHFVRVVRGIEEPICDGEAALSALTVCNTIREALKSPCEGLQS